MPFITKNLSVQMLKGKGDLCNIKAGCILQENPLPLQVHEQFSPAQVLQNQIKFSLGLGKSGSPKVNTCRYHLEGVEQVDDEGVFHSLQDVSLSLLS